MIILSKLPPVEVPKPSLDRCILVVAPNERPQKELEITGEAIKDYAAQCGADFVVIDKLPEVNHQCANKHVLSQVAKHYEQTLIVDTDIVIRPEAPNIFEEVPLGTWGMMDELPQIYDCGAGGWIRKEWIATCKASGKQLPLTNIWNSGFAVAPRDAHKEYFAPDHEVPNFWCIEQHLLTYELMKSKRVVTLSDQWQAGYPWLDFPEKIKTARTIHVNGCRHHPTRLALLKHFTEGNLFIPEELLPRIRTAEWAPWWAMERREAKKKKPKIESPACSCPVAGFCNRHLIQKNEQWHKLCQTNPNYRAAWDSWTGPGQKRGEELSERDKRVLRIKEKAARVKRFVSWVKFFRKSEDKGLGDTLHRLSTLCGKNQRDLKRMLKEELSVCACELTKAIEKLNEQHPYS